MIRRNSNLTAIAAAGFVALGLAGCSNGPHATGSDNAFLTAPLESLALSNKASDDLLPLVAGDSWQMRSVSEGKHSEDAIAIQTPPVTSADGSVTATVEILRDRKPWRREIYSKDSTGIYLKGMKDEISPLMMFDPPIPLLKYNFAEGQYWHWVGTAEFDNAKSPASGYSRISALETVATPAGKFKTCRIDTIISLTTHGQEYRFPMVRWLAPQVGFVRRGFAEKNLPAFSELTSFNVH